MAVDAECTSLREGCVCQEGHILISVCQSGSTALIKSQRLLGSCGGFDPRNPKHLLEFLSYECNDFSVALWISLGLLYNPNQVTFISCQINSDDPIC